MDISQFWSCKIITHVSSKCRILAATFCYLARKWQKSCTTNKVVWTKYIVLFQPTTKKVEITWHFFLLVTITTEFLSKFSWKFPTKIVKFELIRFWLVLSELRTFFLRTRTLKSYQKRGKKQRHAVWKELIVLLNCENFLVCRVDKNILFRGVCVCNIFWGCNGFYKRVWSD